MGASAPRQASSGGDRARLEGRIDEVAYSGNASPLYPENATAVALGVTIQNQARTTAPAAPKLAIGDELWMSRDAVDTLVLTS